MGKLLLSAYRIIVGPAFGILDMSSLLCAKFSGAESESAARIDRFLNPEGKLRKNNLWEFWFHIVGFAFPPAHGENWFLALNFTSPPQKKAVIKMIHDRFLNAFLCILFSRLRRGGLRYTMISWEPHPYPSWDCLSYIYHGYHHQCCTSPPYSKSKSLYLDPDGQC